jgi:hypothetical protein
MMMIKNMLSLAFLIPMVLAGGGTSITDSNTVTSVEINLNLLYNSSLGTFYVTNSQQRDVIIMTATPYAGMKPTDPINNCTITLTSSETEYKYRKAFDLFDANGNRVRSDIVIDPTIQGKGTASKRYQVVNFAAKDIGSFGLSRGDLFGTLSAMYSFTNLEQLQGGYTYTIDWKRSR